MKRYGLWVLLVLVATALQAQENPAPVPPNYERIERPSLGVSISMRFSFLARCSLA